VAEFIALLESASVRRVVDIRAFPRSRVNPQFNLEVLPTALSRADIGYTHLVALGGRRKKSTAARSENEGWQVAGFRNYADYARTAEFRTGLHALLALAAQETCAIMCSETVWWRCHRRIVADYVLAAGVPVVHLLSETKHEPANLTAFARIRAHGYISYPSSSV
jgi:uncharacterized protein (DUF488 family)